ncbi:MAG: hypothetical protein ACXW4U_02010 [Anaerolineales bacterium]
MMKKKDESASTAPAFGGAPLPKTAMDSLDNYFGFFLRILGEAGGGASLASFLASKLKVELNQPTCAIIIEARYEHSPDPFSQEAHK